MGMLLKKLKMEIQRYDTEGLEKREEIALVGTLLAGLVTYFCVCSFGDLEVQCRTFLIRVDSFEA